MEKYQIKNLDCAMCAAKIEKALNEAPGVNWAAVDFGTQTLQIDAQDSRKAMESVRHVDDAVVFEPFSGAAAGSRPDGTADFDVRRELGVLAAAVLLFVGVLVMDYGHMVPVPDSLFIGFALAVYIFAGWNVFAETIRTIRNKAFFDENVLMVIATVGAIGVGAFSEAVGVMIFYKAGEFFQNIAVSRSRRSIWALLAEKPGHANLQTDAGFKQVGPEDVGVGDVIVVKPGEKIPLDGDLIAGRSQVDASVLTGESVPRAVGIGESVMAGEVNMTGAITVSVRRPYFESSIARMLEMVENASARKAPTENFITVFARYYTPAMVAAAAAIAFLPPLLIAGAAFETWIYRALVLLVISCPCALVISIPLGYFGGIGRASKRGVLVKGSNFIDALSNVKTVVFDKTGTLTEGVFQVDQIVPKNGYKPDRILEMAALAEQHSNHPIAKSILDAYHQQQKPVDPERVSSHADISGSGVRVEVDSTVVLVGNDRFMHDENIDHDACAVEGTVAHVAIGGQYAGYILIGDRIRHDAAEAISALRENGVERIIMLTGDNQCAADQIADRLDLDGHYAGLLPEDKVRVFEELQAKYAEFGRIAFVGDGINDAPVIARADVGVAMGALGSDAAIETADVVLMKDSPAKMAEAVIIGKQTRVIVWQNIVMALSVKAVFIVFGAFGLASMWAAVFADVGTALMAVVNSTRTLGKRARPNAPEDDARQVGSGASYSTQSV